MLIASLFISGAIYAIAPQTESSAVSAAPASAAASAAKRSKNLLLITFDTTRRDFMGFMGKTPSPTPVLDQLAARAIVFDDAYTVAPLTLPAHTSLMTGLYPRSHGVHENSSFKLPESARTLAEILSEHGYATGAAVAAFVLDPMFGLEQGFSRYSAPSVQGTGEVLLTERRGDAQVAQALKDVAQLAERGPFFYWVHFFDPHFPYAAPDAPRPPPETAADPPALMRYLYEQEIRYADSQLGRLLAGLGQRGRFEDLVVVFAADHGESVGDTPEGSHGFFLFDPTVRVPLLIRDPDLAPRRVEAQVSLVDVMPTLLDLLGLAAPDLKFDGLDLAPLLRDPSVEPPDRVIGLESWYGWLNYGWAPFDGCVRQSFKYLRSHRQELFDRASDPGEKQNLFAPDDVRSQSFVRRLADLHAAPASKLERDPLSLSPDALARLQHLGYATASARLDDPGDTAALPDPYDKVAVIQALEGVTRAQAAGDKERVLELLRQLSEQEPESANLQEQLGEALAARGPENFDEAERHLRSALKIEPRRSRAHFTIGRCAEKRAEILREQAKQAREKDDKERAHELTKEENHQTRRSIRAYQACLEFEPNFPDGIVHLARLLEQEAERSVRAGDKDEAIQNYKQIDELLDRWLSFMPKDHSEWKEIAGNRLRMRQRREELEKTQ